MNSINFFTPVVCNNPNKTWQEAALEVLDEVFYVGSSPRVTIFPPDANHPEAWAQETRLGRHRSWLDIATKVGFRGVLTFSLMALMMKAALRSSLQISSIRVIPGFVGASKMENKLPVEIIKRITHYLTFPEQKKLARLAFFTRDAVREEHASCTKLIKSANFIELFTLGEIDNIKYWTTAMDRLIGDEGETIDSFIELYYEIVDKVKGLSSKVSDVQVDRFCRYLQEKCLLCCPWITYQIVDRYLTNLGVPKNGELKKLLTQSAENITASMYKTDVFENVSEKKMLEIVTIDIDPRSWFGANDCRYSLWGAEETTPMPALVLEVLWERIQKVRADHPHRPLLVGMGGRATAELPHNFTLPLAERITAAGIYLDCDMTVSKETLDAKYTVLFYQLSDEALQELAVKYPGAVSDYEYPT